MKELLYYFFNLEVIGRYLPQLLQGLLVTIEMAMLIIIAGKNLRRNPDGRWDLHFEGAELTTGTKVDCLCPARAI